MRRRPPSVAAHLQACKLLTAAVTVSLVGADFVALKPEDYKHHFVEGWPGPHDDGSGVGVLNESSSGVDVLW